jgi:hypothetical protein
VEPLGNHTLDDYDINISVLRKNFANCGICSILIRIMRIYMTEQWKIENTLSITTHTVIQNKSHILRWVDAGMYVYIYICIYKYICICIHLYTYIEI